MSDVVVDSSVVAKWFVPVTHERQVRNYYDWYNWRSTRIGIGPQTIQKVGE